MSRARVVFGVVAIVGSWLAWPEAMGAGRGELRHLAPTSPSMSVVAPAAGAQFGFRNQDTPLVARFDRDQNGRLDQEERQAALVYAEGLGLSRRRGMGSVAYAVEPGPKFSPEQATPYPDAPFYDPGTLRTLFLTFENESWERELMAFKATDVDVPATLVVDGRTYRDVGVQFHGNSSFSSVPMGLKHSMRLAVDWVHDGQDVKSVNTILLLNAHEDPSLLHTVLTMQIARQYGPAPRANFVRVVINGESWGIYVNQQQFNGDWSRDWFQSRDGARWRAQQGASSALAYLGMDTESYRSAYDLRSREDPAVWARLMEMTRALEFSSPAELEARMAPLLDVEASLRFLAIENVLVNGDGYWTRGDDYNLFLGPDGRFRPVLYDVNSTFDASRGAIVLDPLYGAGFTGRPLMSRLLAVPALRTRYLAQVREIARDWLDWGRLGSVVDGYRELIDADVRSDPRKLYSYEAFRAGAEALRHFADERRAFILAATEADRTR